MVEPQFVPVYCERLRKIGDTAFNATGERMTVVGVRHEYQPDGDGVIHGQGWQYLLAFRDARGWQEWGWETETDLQKYARPER